MAFYAFDRTTSTAYCSKDSDRIKFSAIREDRRRILCFYAYPEGDWQIILTSLQTMIDCCFFRQPGGYIDSLSGFTPPGFCVDLLFKRQKDADGEACFLLVTRLPFSLIPRMILKRIGPSNPFYSGNRTEAVSQ